MKQRICLLMTIGLLVVVHQAAAQGVRFFRISGPAASAITALRSDGTMVWSNALAGTNYIVQTVASFPGGTNWTDYVQLHASNVGGTNRLFDPNPPAGKAFIPGGVFTMGDTIDGESDAIPTNVTVSAFYMDVNLVSYSQWQSVYNWATNHGYGFNNSGAGKAANNPVQMLDWFDAVKWCNARSQQEGLTPVYYTDANLTLIYTNGENLGNPVKPYQSVNWAGNGYRLPTEAEWEKAARGGLSGQRFPWSDTISESQANYTSPPGYAPSYDLGPNVPNPAGAIGGYPYTSPVASFAANGYGLFDMAGNVQEWCWDCYATPYAGGVDPHGPAIFGASRIVRGGFFQSLASWCACAHRIPAAPSSVTVNIGFRCVRAH